MIKRIFRPSVSWLISRLDRIAAGVDQINRDGAKTSDPGREQVLLSLRDSVSLVGSSVSRLEAAVSEAWLAGEPVWRFRDALAVSALVHLEAGTTVVVVGDSSAVDVVAVVRAMGLRPVVVDAVAVEAVAVLTRTAGAVVFVGGEDLVNGVRAAEPVEAPVPAATIIGLALQDTDPDEAVRAIGSAMGWDATHLDRLVERRTRHAMSGVHPSGATEVALVAVRS
jgi:hypothetical protein